MKTERRKLGEKEKRTQEREKGIKKVEKKKKQEDRARRGDKINNKISYKREK